MDPEQTFIRVQGRFSQMLTPRVRAALEYIYLFIAVSLFCILVVMHANYVQQPGCSSELSGVKTTDAQLIQIKITSAGLWSQNEPDSTLADVPVSKTKMNEVRMETLDEEGLTFSGAKFWLNWIGSGASRGRMALKSWKSDTDIFKHQAVSLTYSESLKATVDKAITKTEKEETRNSFPSSAKETLEATIINFGNKWHRRLSFVWRHAVQIIGNFQNLWNITGIHLNLDVPKWLHILHLDRLNSYAVQWVENKSKAFEPTYLYTMEKGYFLLPEAAKSQHNIRTINISISAQHSCFGNRWHQLLINRVVGYDTILMNSFLNSPSQGYLFNYQTREFYNLSYKHERAKGPARFGDYLVTKCGVLMISLFVFFATTMSVSFILRETQTRMLKFTVQLQHHARHRLPTFQLIFVHVIESLVFVPIMIGILFFLFEFYDDHLLAFMVLVFVWLCELFTLISARTPISVKFFPRFFLLYFLVFHIYFFSYAYGMVPSLIQLAFVLVGNYYFHQRDGFNHFPGFSYLALSTTAAFIQHLILYFWNHFEVPTLQRFMQNRRAQLQQHPDFHITSSTILASTLHITRLNTRNRGQVNADLASGTAALRHEPDQPTPANGAEAPGVPQRVGNGNSEGNPVRIPGQPDLQQAETGPSPGTISSFSSLLQWIRGGASSEGLNSFLSMFRDVRDQGPVYPESPVSENRATGNGQ